MLLTVRQPVSAVLPTRSAVSSVRPVSASDVTIAGGFWGERVRINSEQTLGHGFDWLERAGTLENFRLAAGAAGHYGALGEPQGLVFQFLDSDVYKWLEAVGWELGREPDAALAAAADEAIEAVRAAQRPDGYLNTYVQVLAPDSAYTDLAWGHELYCVGHLIQAAVAWQRALGDDRLLGVALRAVESVEWALGSAGPDGIDGHPEIEMALVELYRTTGDRRHLDFAARLIERRGSGSLGAARFGSAYWQDHRPVREAATVAGHAVRQLYLDAGAVDVATELGDMDLLAAVRRRWADMVETRMYLTGGLGSRPRDEAFGDPFELPPDLAYAETCAAIAGVMVGWRLLLATGDPGYADVIERIAYNGVLSGISLDGCEFSYENPLQRRTRRVSSDGHDGSRSPWKICACCPPNLMRLISSWQHYLATTDERGIQVHQYAAGEIVAPAGGGTVRLSVATDYPWSGDVAVTVLDAPDEPWTLSLRVPAWARSATLGVAGMTRAVSPGAVEETRVWRAGDRVELALDMEPRVTEPDERIDAVRDCVALERGPLVYAIESADLPDGFELEEIRFPADARPEVTERDDIAPHLAGLTVSGLRGGEPVTVQAIPYHAWGNRGPGAMRVWIPRAEPDPGDPTP